jgi:hypothetical protein
MNECLPIAAQVEPTPVSAGAAGVSASTVSQAIRSWQQLRKEFHNVGIECWHLAGRDVCVGPCVHGRVFPVSQGL